MAKAHKDRLRTVVGAGHGKLIVELIDRCDGQAKEVLRELGGNRDFIESIVEKLFWYCDHLTEGGREKPSNAKWPGADAAVKELGGEAMAPSEFIDNILVPAKNKISSLVETLENMAMKYEPYLHCPFFTHPERSKYYGGPVLGDLLEYLKLAQEAIGVEQKYLRESEWASPTAQKSLFAAIAHSIHYYSGPMKDKDWASIKDAGALEEASHIGAAHRYDGPIKDAESFADVTCRIAAAAVGLLLGEGREWRVSSKWGSEAKKWLRLALGDMTMGALDKARNASYKDDKAMLEARQTYGRHYWQRGEACIERASDLIAWVEASKKKRPSPTPKKVRRQASAKK